MRRWWKAAACLLLLLALCACRYESQLAGTWQGDGSLDAGMEGPDGPPPFQGAEQWVFDGDGSATATVDGRAVELHYSATDGTLTLNDGGEVSWGVPYELKGDTLRIGSAVFTKAP